jgi:four helix bundle protein
MGSAVGMYRGGMASHRDLKVWQLAQRLSARIYDVTRGRMAHAAADLVDQVRRSSSSIGANIAEGRAQGTNKQFRHYLSIALGSANETDSHLASLLDRDLIDPATALDLRDELATIQRMMLALQRKLPP